ncbi:hypothetical protein [Micromonospora fluostatini]|uniref:hypothetical protein n=1 Tax=Micromonospora sp. JCM 30529 TaxID=3421643 RepID=UPI003D17E7C3
MVVPPVPAGQVGLGVETVDEMVVDSTNRRLYFSLGRGRSGVRVSDLSGGYQRTIGGLPGASGLLLSPDGATLYVALADADAVAVFDTKTLTETRRYPTGANTCPTRLAWALGKIYFGYGCAAPGFGLGSLAVGPSGGTVSLGLPLGGEYTAPPVLRGSTSSDYLLLAVDRTGPRSSLAPTQVTLLDVSWETPRRLGSDESWRECLGLEDASLSPDGGQFVLACSAIRNDDGLLNPADYHPAYSTADLSPVRRYYGGDTPVSVTTSPDGAYVILGANSVLETDPRVHVVRADGRGIRTYEFPRTARVIRAGVAAGGGTTTLHAVLTDQYGRNPTLHVLSEYTRGATWLSLHAPSTVEGRTVQLTGSLSRQYLDPLTPQRLQVKRKDAVGTWGLPDVLADANGRFTVNDWPTRPGENVYTVTYPGSETLAPASTSARLWVTGATSALTLTAPSTVKRAAKLTVSGKLTITGAPVPPPWTVQVTRKDASGTRTLPAVTASTSTGAFSFTDAPPVGGTVTYTATYAGDSLTTGSSKSAGVRVTHDPTTLKLTTKADPKNWAPTVTVTANLGKTYTNRQVCLYAQSHGEGRRTLKCGTVNSSGNLTATDLIHKRTTYTATFTGDHRHAPVTVTTVVKTPAKVDVALVSPSYTKSGNYRIFHYKGNPVAKSWVSPSAKSACMYHTVQEYRSGAWRTVTTSGCHKLNSSSQGTYTWTGKRKVGVNYRILAKFGGNTASEPTNSAWAYFRFRN